jgi:hypothetical protein
MSTTAPKPVTTPLPVQLSAPECAAFLLPHLAMPKRGPTCTLGYERVFHRILWGRYPGRPGPCGPVPPDAHGTAARHDTTVYKVCARWAADGALGPACRARVRPLAAAQPLAPSLLHGDATHTVAPKGGMVWGPRGPNPRRATRSLPSSIRRAPSERLSPWLPSTRPTWSCGRRASTP